MKKLQWPLSLFLVFCLMACNAKTNNNKANNVSNRTNMNDSNLKRDTATFAGGCFWCIETTMARLKGVDTVISGYTGGKTKDPTYKEICTGFTGHAEAVQIIYNPDIVDYNTLLTVFFTMHDPTTLNRQGHDIGTQYRSAIFYNSPQQKDSAEAFIKKLTEEKIFENPIVTEVQPLGIYYNAEDYHQDYYNQNRLENSYCTAVIDPKVSKLRKSFSHLLKD
ncbi:MAG: peptide-methionine (S)-S-oxide reductase MsrA [bacterium]|nr:peptide-methionine (S)-S-oxide reductase MsrA [bacterium]